MATSRNFFIGPIHHSGPRPRAKALNPNHAYFHASWRCQCEIFLFVTHGVACFYAKLNMPVASWRRHGIGIVPKQILSPKLAIDSIQQCIELVDGIENEYRPAHAVGDRDQRMHASCFASAL